MCPPALPLPSEIDIYWSDEQIVSLLADYTPASHLPVNVLTDCSPYQYPPSNLPEGIWYLVDSNEKKESAYGFWNAKGEACKVYSSSAINGWRTTLEYFEGIAPHGRITNWLMQEYGITQKELNDKDQAEKSRLLCRVFLCIEHGPKSETNPENCNTIIDSKDATSGKESGCESKANKEQEVGEFPVVADPDLNSQQVLSELECFLRGDYLELDDLEDPTSHSSISQNSCSPSNLSDEYFDPSAFLRELEEGENNYTQGRHSTSRYNSSASIEPNGFVSQPAASGHALSGCLTNDAVEKLRTSSTTDDGMTDERAKGPSTKRQTPESKAESTSNSSSRASSGEKKAGPSKLKKLRTYFCFASF